MKRKPLFVLIFTTCIGLSLSSNDLLNQGLDAYGEADYSRAIRFFRDITLDPEMEKEHGDAYFWIAKSYFAQKKYDETEKNIEFFLLNFPANPNYAEAVYQKGRLLYFQGEFENSIQLFSRFIDDYPDSIFIPNAYYWLGECLFSLGNFEKALDIFTIVVNRYPTSFRYEAARYRISLLKLMDREQEFLKLLKISHEDFLNAQEDFLRKEKTYENAIERYQKTIAILSDTSQYDEALDALEEENQGLEGELQTALQRLKESETAYDALKSDKDKLEGILQAREEGFQEKLAQKEQTLQDTLSTLSSKEQETLQERSAELNELTLLQLKVSALELKNFYLNWLVENGETNQ